MNKENFRKWILAVCWLFIIHLSENKFQLIPVLLALILTKDFRNE